MEVHLVDSNIFYYHLLQDRDHGPRSTGIIRRIRDGEEAAISTVIVSELASLFEFRILQARRDRDLTEARRRYVIERFGRAVTALHDLVTGLAHLRKLGCGWDQANRAFELRSAHRLDCNDALNAAILEKNDISSIYSFDSSFDRIPWVQRADR